MEFQCEYSTTIFTRPREGFFQYLQERFAAQFADPQSTLTEDSKEYEVWLTLPSQVMYDLFKEVKGLQEAAVTERNLKIPFKERTHDPIRDSYWAIFPWGTLWGNVHCEQKSRESELFSLRTRPRDLILSGWGSFKNYQTWYAQRPAYFD